MNELERLASRLPRHRISPWEMFIAKQKQRLQDVKDLHWPILYRYGKKILHYIGV